MAGLGSVFASPGPEPLPIAIRLETPGDAPGVRRVHELAFPGPEEAAIVDEIRRTAPPGWQSILAADATGRIVGHVLLSPCPVEDDDGVRVGEVLALGPIGVIPEVQFRGVGSALIAAAVSLAVARGVPAVVLLGQPLYYPRFGFASARSRAWSRRPPRGPTRPGSRACSRPGTMRCAAPCATRRRSSRSP